MANLKQEEFNKIIEFLADVHGLQGFRDKLVRLNGLVTRRRAGKLANLSSQLYTLTGGLRREVPATIAVHSMWAEQVNERLDEEREQELEGVAEKINACLGERDRIIEGKADEIDEFIKQYELLLTSAIGAEKARVDMVLKAVPDVAERLRGMPLADESEADAAREKIAAELKAEAAAKEGDDTQKKEGEEPS